MKPSRLQMFLLVGLCVSSGAGSYALIDSSQSDGVGLQLLLMQQQSLRAPPLFDPAANRQAAVDRRNQEVLETLSRPPVAWAHSDRPPVQRAVATAAAGVADEPDSRGWSILFWILLVGGGLLYAVAKCLPRRPPPPPPSQRVSGQKGFI